MRKKKEHHEEHADESWLLPYSDLLTLLLALFIVMFAMSNLDKQKIQKLAEQFETIFSGGGGMMEKDGKSVIPLDNAKMVVKNTQSPSKTSDKNSTPGKASKEKIEDDQMHDIKKKIEKEIDKKGYSDKVKVVLNNEGLEISIQDIVLFGSGDADIKQGVYPLLDQITAVIKKLDNDIKVAGHTDNIPIYNSKYRSNWDLSAFRAINVMNFMIEKGKLSSKKISIQAFGEYKPKYDNSTEEGRAKNRRVEIFIMRNYPIEDEKKE